MLCDKPQQGCGLDLGEFNPSHSIQGNIWDFHGCLQVQAVCPRGEMLLEHEKRVVRISMSCKIRHLPVLVFPMDAEVALPHTGIVGQG